MNTSFLLTDRQVQDFLINGYLILQPNSLNKDFHSTIFTQALSIFEKEDNPGNNILPRLPQLQCLFDDPVIRGALESLLGTNYTMQPHRHAHVTKPGTKEQLWHKDSYFGYVKPLRHHQLRYVMVMYYPQDTTIEMGPTGIKPRTQYEVIDPKKCQDHARFENTNGKNDDKNDVYVTCSAGTVALIHYDIVHKGTANTSSDSHRFMFKFQFNRLEEPIQPTWNHDPINAIYDAADAGLLQPIVKHIWNWMLGRTVAFETSATVDDIIEWKSRLNNSDGKIRLNAAYNLALCNEYNTLIDRLYDDEKVFRFEAAYALTACRYNKEAIKKLQEVLQKEKNIDRIAFCIAFIFSEMGSLAIETLPLLIKIIKTRNSWLLQQYCCEAFGTIQSNTQESHTEEIIHCLINALSNRDQQTDSKEGSSVRLTAALAIAKLGIKAVQAIPKLKDALYHDPNRYVNGNALLALERIGTNESLKIALDYLKISRWCAKTTAASLF